jgi:hypothetical protein
MFKTHIEAQQHGESTKTDKFLLGNQTKLWIQTEQDGVLYSEMVIDHRQREGLGIIRFGWRFRHDDLKPLTAHQKSSVGYPLAT